MSRPGPPGWRRWRFVRHGSATFRFRFIRGSGVTCERSITFDRQQLGTWPRA